MREMVALFSQALMSADVESLCGAAYRERFATLGDRECLRP